jgi:outer membrane protein OmpA-like peptidoglycan-associated protein
MKQFLLSLLCILICFNSFGQDNNSLSEWSVGTEKGYAQIAGEVRSASGFGLGIYGAKSITKYLSARLQLGMGDVRGLDRATSNHWLNHPVWNGSVNPAINYNNANSNVIYANYKTTYQEASLQAIFTFTQLPLFKNSSPFDGFFLAGIGAISYTTMIDAVDENTWMYDFAQVNAMPAFSDAEVIANLNTILDGNYETPVNQDAQITPLYQFGAGLKWQVRKNIAVSLTHRVSLAPTDNLDSYKWSPDNTINGVNDIHHFSTIGMSYTFNKKTKQAIPESTNPTPLPTPEPEIEPEPEAIPEPASTPSPEPQLVQEEEMEPEPLVKIVDLTTEEEEVVKRAFENTEFETDKAIIRPVSFNSLNELATLLREHPDWKLRITGHTDNMGTAEWNMELSRRRTESVKSYLANRGIDPARFIVSWHGEEQPIADNSTSEGRQRNRRVAYEIVE